MLLISLDIATDILWRWRPRSHPGDRLAAADTFREFVVYDADQIYPATWDEDSVYVEIYMIHKYMISI